MDTTTMTAYRIPDEALLLRFASIYLSTSANLERAVWCVGHDVMCGLGAHFPEIPPVITDPLRVFDIPVLPALRLTKDEIRLMVPANPFEPSPKPMQIGFNVPAPVAEAASEVDVPYLPSQLAKSLDLAPDTPASIVADALEEAGRDFEAEVVRRIDRLFVSYCGRDSDDPEPHTAESWRDRPPLL